MEQFIKLEDKEDKVNFKKELSNFEVRGIKDYLNEYFKEEYPEDFKITGKYSKNNNPVEILGLPYTSTGEYASLNITTAVYLQFEQGVTIRRFALTNNNRLIAIGENEGEEIFYLMN